MNHGKEIIDNLNNGNIKQAKILAARRPFGFLEAQAKKHGHQDPYATACFLKGTMDYVHYCHAQNPNKEDYIICEVCSQEWMKSACARYGNDWICENCESNAVTEADMEAAHYENTTD